MVRSSRPFSAAMSRRLFATGIALGLIVPSFAEAQKPDLSKGTPETVESKSDGLPIAFTYIAADPAKNDGGLENAPVVMLIHGANGDRLVWENKPTNFKKRSMTQVLRDSGFAVVTIDMRGHGESVLPDGGKIDRRDYAKMIGDLEAVKNFLLKEHQDKKLNIAKLGIVAADDFTPIAVQFAAMDWQKPDYDDSPIPARRTPRGRDVKALAVLSPVTQVGVVNMNSPLGFLANPRVEVPTYIGVGSEDPSDDKFSARMAKRLGASRSKDSGVTFETYETRLRGTDLVGAPNLRTDLHLKVFLEKSLGELEIPWQNRISRIMR